MGTVLRRIRVAFAMLGSIAVIAGIVLLTARYEGCAEDRVAPPKPTCSLGAPASPRVVVANLVRQHPTWMLARDDDAGALVIGLTESVLVFPAGETREADVAIAAVEQDLAPEVRPALRRSPLMLVWLGGRQRYAAWSSVLDVQLFHDVLTPEGCLTRAATDDPERHTNRRRANDHARRMAEVDRALVRALRDGEAKPLSADESTLRMRSAERQLRSVATATLRQTYVPASAIIIVGIILLFYWWAASAGKEDTFMDLCEEELRGDGALVAPGKYFDVRISSHALLHRDVKHLLNNIVGLWLGCLILEPAIGSARTLIVFFAGVLGGAIMRLSIRKPGLTIGASGGAFALQAAAFVMLFQYREWFLPDERSGYMIFLAIQLVIGLVVSFLPGVSMAGHVGGALAGMVLAMSGLITLGRPPLHVGVESTLAAGVAWGIAGLAIVLWIVSGVVVQWGRTDLERKDT